MAFAENGKATVIIDGQWGSTGKGKLAGWLCSTQNFDLAVCDYMPNAGHTLVLNGKTLTFCQLPVAAAFGIPALIGPHACISLDRLLGEIRECEAFTGVPIKLGIHPLATMVEERHKADEAQTTGRIAATCKGGHASYCEKAMRRSGVSLATGCEPLTGYITDTHQKVQSALRLGHKVLIETAQGFDLGLNHGVFYPFVTGRDCLVGRALDNAGVPVNRCGSIIGSIRTFPIRVGNTSEGNSGPCYDDQTEHSWESLARMTGVPITAEMTTVTKRVRRVFTFSFTQLRRFCDFVGPSDLFLNFANYLQPGARASFVQSLQRWSAVNGTRLSLIGTGPDNDDMIVV